MADFIEMTGGIPIKSATTKASWGLAHIALRRRYRRFRKGPDAVSLEELIFTILIATVAIVSLVSSLFAMWVQQTTLSYVAFGIPLVTAPAVLVQRTKLQRMASFRAVLNHLRGLVYDLAEQRLLLQSENERLEREYRRMAAVEDQFSEICARENRSITEFRGLVKENARIQREIKKEHTIRELQDLFAIVMSGDRNEDGRVTGQEMDRLLHRLRDFAGRRGVYMDEELIREAFDRASLNDPNYSQCAISMFNVVQGAMSEEDADGGILEDGYVDAKQRSTDIEGGFVKVHKKPRVTATGLVLANSVEEGEGELARTIRADNLGVVTEAELSTMPSSASSAAISGSTSSRTGGNTTIFSKFYKAFVDHSDPC